ncbi:unnamed protein product, partial [Sphenostylis stenocarpa]
IHESHDPMMLKHVTQVSFMDRSLLYNYNIKLMGWHSPKDNEEWWGEWGSLKNVTVMTGKNMSLSHLLKGQKCQTECGLWGEPNTRPVCR